MCVRKGQRGRTERTSGLMKGGGAPVFVVENSRRKSGALLAAARLLALVYIARNQRVGLCRGCQCPDALGSSLASFLAARPLARACSSAAAARRSSWQCRRRQLRAKWCCSRKSAALSPPQGFTCGLTGGQGGPERAKCNQRRAAGAHAAWGVFDRCFALKARPDPSPAPPNLHDCGHL